MYVPISSTSHSLSTHLTLQVDRDRRYPASYFARLYEDHNCTHAELRISPIIEFGCQRRCYPANGGRMSVWLDGLYYRQPEADLSKISSRGPIVRLFSNAECRGQGVGIVRVPGDSTAACINVAEGVHSFMPMLPSVCNKKINKEVKEAAEAKPQFVNWYDIRERHRLEGEIVPEEYYNYEDLRQAQADEYVMQGMVGSEPPPEEEVSLEYLSKEEKADLKEYLEWKRQREKEEQKEKEEKKNKGE